MKTVAILLASLIAMKALAAPPANLWQTPDLRTVRSTSGQFVVAGPKTIPARAPSGSESPGSAVLVQLDPNLLAVSCERVKQALLRELGMFDSWRGRVYVVINSVMTNNQPVVIGAKPFSDGWQYRVEVPPEIEKQKLARGLVQVLLLEIANRTAGLRSADVPLWLIEGLTQYVVNSTETDLVLSDPRWHFNNVNVSWVERRSVGRDPLKNVRERFGTHTAFTFARLCDPATDQLPEEVWKTYQASSYLFVHHLLLLNGGRAELAAMLYQLPHYLNWQSAFLNAFNAQFPRMLDVEKWWAVVLVHFTGLDPAQAWPMDVAAQRLDETLHPPVLVSATPKELLYRAKLAVQQIITEWDYLRQRIVLKNVTAQLAVMRFRTPPEMIALLDEYRATIDSYLDKRDKAGATRTTPGAAPSRAERLARDVVKKLDDLDLRRTAFGTAKVPAANMLAKPAR